tara:strand:+ start:6991 stop:7398 length:408 start_codon:yes stop_codon:yes gene_type:complete
MEKTPAQNSSQKEDNPNVLMREVDKAIQYGTVEDLESLYDKGIDIDQTDWEGRTALHMMSAKGNKEAVEMLISRGANINAVFLFQGRLPKTALDAATETGRTEIADILISHGAKFGKDVPQEQPTEESGSFWGDK